MPAFPSTARRTWLTAFVAVALWCIAPALGQAPPPHTASSPSVAASPPPARSACDPVPAAESAPNAGFSSVSRIVQLRVISAAFGTTWGSEIAGARCVALRFEARDVFRGAVTERVGQQFDVVIQQTFGVATAVPAGAWYGQNLSAGSDYVAFCGPNRTLPDALRASCTVVDARGMVDDLARLRDAEHRHWPLRDLIEATRAHCVSSSFLVPDELFRQHSQQVFANLDVLDAALRLLDEPSCTPVARVTLLSLLASYTDPDLVRVRRIARAMFTLLNVPAAASEFDNIAGTYLPTLLGLSSGLPRRTATDIFDHDATARSLAMNALRGDAGGAHAAVLRAWIQQ